MDIQREHVVRNGTSAVPCRVEVLGFAQDWDASVVKHIQGSFVPSKIKPESGCVSN